MPVITITVDDDHRLSSVEGSGLIPGQTFDLVVKGMTEKPIVLRLWRFGEETKCVSLNEEGED